MNNFQDKISFIWSIADLLRGNYKQSDYGKVILPMTILRRLDCVLASTKQKVLDEIKDRKNEQTGSYEYALYKASGHKFYNKSKIDFEKLKADPDNVASNLRHFVNGFSEKAREIIDRFNFDTQIEKLDKDKILYLIVKKFAEIDLHPDRVPNEEMGYIFEELIRRFSEQSNETAGEHFTPREVIWLMVNLLFNEDSDILSKEEVIKTLYDPACGTGGMLAIAEEYVKQHNPYATLNLFGQELNDESWAICVSDLLIKGKDPNNIIFGDSFTEDGLPSEKFDYMLSNPPFGVDWKKEEKHIKEESERSGMSGRFGAGVPRINDGSLLFLQHMLSKMKQPSGSKVGSRIAIVFNGSPLFTGSAGSGESEIRKWIIENDWLEGIVAMPDQLFYNTGISTYVWVLTNRKIAERKGKIQLVNAVSFIDKMRKSLGNKRHFINDKHREEITRLFGAFEENQYCKIFDKEDFGYNRITVERPLRLNFQINADRLANLEIHHIAMDVLTSIKNDRIYKNRDEFEKVINKAFKEAGVKLTPTDKKKILKGLSVQDETADICLDSKGNPEPDPELRDYENIPLKQDIQEYFEREVLPHVPDAWIDKSKTKIGYEIPFTRHFYEYKPLRKLEEIDEDVKKTEADILALLKEV